MGIHHPRQSLILEWNLCISSQSEDSGWLSITDPVTCDCCTPRGNWDPSTGPCSTFIKGFLLCYIHNVCCGFSSPDLTGSQQHVNWNVCLKGKLFSNAIAFVVCYIWWFFGIKINALKETNIMFIVFAKPGFTLPVLVGQSQNKL